MAFSALTSISSLLRLSDYLVDLVICIRTLLRPCYLLHTPVSIFSFVLKVKVTTSFFDFRDETALDATTLLNLKKNVVDFDLLPNLGRNI